MSSSETCVGELKLFTAIKLRIDKTEDEKKAAFLKELVKNFIRISQLDVKTLVTEIKISQLFDDEMIFKAI